MHHLLTLTQKKTAGDYLIIYVTASTVVGHHWPAAQKRRTHPNIYTLVHSKRKEEQLCLNLDVCYYRMILCVNSSTYLCAFFFFFFSFQRRSNLSWKTRSEFTILSTLTVPSNAFQLKSCTCGTLLPNTCVWISGAYDLVLSRDALIPVPVSGISPIPYSFPRTCKKCSDTNNPVPYDTM